MDFSKFHIITVISNPIRFQSRYKLFSIFEEDISRKGAQLWTVEMQTGARFHQVTDSTNPRHIQVWNSALPGELWHKENLQNIALQQLTIRNPDWRYVLLSDADVKYEYGALDEIAQALQHYDVVQPWSHAIDLGPDGEIVGKPHISFMYAHWKGIHVPAANGYAQGGHPGFGMAFRREALNHLGGVIDWGVLGSGDRHTFCALMGKYEESVHGDMSPTYKRWLEIWQSRAEAKIKRNVGYVTGTLRHLWHGKKSDRGYASRWRILVDNGFNPETDIKKDVSGLWQFVSETPRQIKLRDECRKYFRARREDSTDLI